MEIRTHSETARTRVSQATNEELESWATCAQEETEAALEK